MILAVDSSAVVAMVEQEPTAEWLVERSSRGSDLLITAANAVEVSMVLEARSHGTMSGLRVLDSLGCDVVDVDRHLAEAAVLAWRRYGRGRHRAALNFGDCFSYALAATRGVPLLCVGDDFIQTDLEVWCP